MIWKLLGLQKKLDALFDDGWVNLGLPCARDNALPVVSAVAQPLGSTHASPCSMEQYCLGHGRARGPATLALPSLTAARISPPLTWLAMGEVAQYVQQSGP